MNPKKNSISVVIPVYNSAHTLIELHSRLETMLKDQADEYEIIFVNDGSKDESSKVIKQIMVNDSSCHNIELMRNYGQHNALLCGIRSAKYELIVTLDDDLQNPPEEIPKMLGKLIQGYDVVYGSSVTERHGLLRDLASVLTKIALQTTMGIKIARKVSAFRIFRTRIRESFEQYGGSFVSIDVLLTWGTNSFAVVEVVSQRRKFGKSNYTLQKLFFHALNMITGFSILPLQIASLLGFVFAFFGFLILVYVIGTYLVHGSSVQGFSFLASIIAIFSGMQLLAIGIIGEYLARIHFRTMDKPQYKIKK